MNYKNLISKVPNEVSYVTKTLEKAGFEAYLVGGCVRDLLMGRTPKDWDITTNAKPEQIMSLFEKTVYENEFGTVIVCVPYETSNPDVSHSSVKALASAGETFFQIEVTPYRIETKYSDFRHPDEVKFSDKLEDDLKRRDFTINATALSFRGDLTDIYSGVKDIKDKILKTVGDPNNRFNEDALRMLRAIRFAVELDFIVSHETTESILKNVHLIKRISAERIQGEFVKIIMSPKPGMGIEMLERFSLLKYIIPELEEGMGCEQGGEHIYDVWNHLLHALQHSADKDWPIEVRLAALFHDIGKPKSRRLASPDTFTQVLGSPRQKLAPLGLEARPDHSQKYAGSAKKKFTFYGHEVLGAKMAKKIMERLKFPKKETELVEKLVYSHMFFSDTEQITLSAVRRIIVKVGRENIWTLMNVRECDRVGMKKKETPYRLRKYFAMIEEAMHDPISVGQLKINGEDLKKIGVVPGPRMGFILHALLEEVLDDPKKNSEGYLLELAKSLNMLPDDALRTLGERGKEKKEKLEAEEIEKLHKKHKI